MPAVARFPLGTLELSPFPLFPLFFFPGEQQRKRFVATVVQRETSTFVFFLTFFLICAHLGIY